MRDDNDHLQADVHCNGNHDVLLAAHNRVDIWE